MLRFSLRLTVRWLVEGGGTNPVFFLYVKLCCYPTWSGTKSVFSIVTSNTVAYFPFPFGRVQVLPTVTGQIIRPGDGMQYVPMYPPANAFDPADLGEKS